MSLSFVSVKTAKATEKQSTQISTMIVHILMLIEISTSINIGDIRKMAVSKQNSKRAASIGALAE
jgi:hypothetical protein